jgi:predicted MPP superfamily phosphohydrolase
MNFKNWVFGLGLAGAATLVYGSLVEANRLKVERVRIRLPKWPERLAGFRIALLGDFHLRDAYTLRVAKQAVAAALDEEPDMVALVGDYVGFWQPHSENMLYEAFEPLLLMEGNVVAVSGNHDHWHAPALLLDGVMAALNIRLLRNEVWRHAGIAWVGVDSTNARLADPCKAMSGLHKHETAVTLWHEPDCVDLLPAGASLMLSGHSHGGQFTFPWGWTPMHTKNGEKYVRGYYPEAPTPIYVSRGLGTTGPPSRLNCSPELTVLTLDSGG